MGVQNLFILVAWILFITQACSVDGRTLAECLLDVQQGDCLQYSHITICTNDGKYHPHSTSTSQRTISKTETKVFEAIARGIDGRLLRTQSSETEVSEAIKIFSKQDHIHAKVSSNRADTLISPLHAVWARHYNIPINTTVQFVDVNNEVVERRTIRYIPLPVPAHANYMGGYDIVSILPPSLLLKFCQEILLRSIAPTCTMLFKVLRSFNGIYNFLYGFGLSHDKSLIRPAMNSSTHLIVVDMVCPTDWSKCPAYS
uniref:Uncharacterized protein n=1 Tax=Magallana gigas TaxID=29159 RepID=A0A8W8KIL8_MAGGI